MRWPRLLASWTTPEQIVTTNMFGDIIVDQVSALNGGTGVAADGNTNPNAGAAVTVSKTKGRTAGKTGYGTTQPPRIAAALRPPRGGIQPAKDRVHRVGLDRVLVARVDRVRGPHVHAARVRETGENVVLVIHMGDERLVAGRHLSAETQRHELRW